MFRRIVVQRSAVVRLRRRGGMPMEARRLRVTGERRSSARCDTATAPTRDRNERFARRAFPLR
jgi:hypothetical protein